MVSRRASRRRHELANMTAERASHACGNVLQIRHITAFRELESSRLGGRSLCFEDAAGERCNGRSVKAAVG